MFVGVARLTLQIPESGSLKAKRQVLRRVTDRIKARFNASVAEVGDNDLWQKAALALAVVGNDQRHVNEQLDKILQYVEDMYIAPIIGRETEILSLGEKLYGGALPATRPSVDDEGDVELVIPKGDRSLAEAEGMGDWEERHVAPEAPEAPEAPVTRSGRGRRGGEATGRRPSLDDARARARALRNPREWEKK